MKQHFYAYHGPDNDDNFDYVGGYGVSQEYKQRQTNLGDLVYIIQKRPEREYFELCGVFEITDHYYDESSKRPYRLRLADKSKLGERIAISEQECGRKLPQIDGNASWSNFKRHFCRQGVSFQSPLSNEVIEVLDELLAAHSSQKSLS